MDFPLFFQTLSDKFQQFGLNLTHEVSKKKLVLLDIEIYIENNTFHTKEHRKETASKSYIKFGSAHPSNTFKGIKPNVSSSTTLFEEKRFSHCSR